MLPLLCCELGEAVVCQAESNGSIVRTADIDKLTKISLGASRCL